MIRTLSQYKVADNIDLPLITTEFLAYYRLRFHKEPVLVKKNDSNQIEQKQNRQNRRYGNSGYRI